MESRREKREASFRNGWGTVYAKPGIRRNARALNEQNKRAH
jgi:hypothetical protein